MTNTKMMMLALIAPLAVNLSVAEIQANGPQIDDIAFANITVSDQPELDDSKEDSLLLESGFNLEDRSADPSMSGDGQRIAFDSSADLTGENPEHVRQIFVINTDGDPESLKQVSDDVAFSSNDPSLSLDGHRVAFESVSNMTGKNPKNIRQIFMGSSDGNPKNLKQLTQDNIWHSLNPSISGDGRWVVFESRANLTGQNSENQSHIFIADSEHQKILQLTLDPELISSHASISADGRRIAFESKGRDGRHQSQIFTINKNGSALNPVTTNINVASTRPSISNDGAVVAFQAESGLTGASETKIQYIYVAKADGSDLIRIARGEGASISGDGSRVAFETVDHYIAVMSSDGSGIITEFRQIPFSADPSISADGALLVFEGDGEDSSYQIFVFEVDADDLDEAVFEDEVVPGRQDIPKGPDADQAKNHESPLEEAVI